MTTRSREYCLNGGLHRRCGQPALRRSFKEFIRKVFPDKPLLDIADDDMLYQLPYGFPNESVAFWRTAARGHRV